jgi:hypothetical protein
MLSASSGLKCLGSGNASLLQSCWKENDHEGKGRELSIRTCGNDGYESGLSS